LDVADITVAGVHVEPDVALNAPANAPRVADNPVRLRGRSISLVANSLDAVVNVSRARLEDTTSVGLPSIGSNADRDGANSLKVRSHLAVGATLVIDEVEERGISIATAKAADASGGDVVRVVRISVNALAVQDSVDVSIMRPATVAAVVVVGAGSALLNRQRSQRTVFLSHEAEGFDSLVSGVSPA